MKSRKFRQFWRILYIVRWDKEGHWITSKGNQNKLWIWFGPTVHPDGRRVWNAVAGPFGIAWIINPPSSSSTPSSGPPLHRSVVDDEPAIDPLR